MSNIYWSVPSLSAPPPKRAASLGLSVACTLAVLMLLVMAPPILNREEQQTEAMDLAFVPQKPDLAEPPPEPVRMDVTQPAHARAGSSQSSALPAFPRLEPLVPAPIISGEESVALQPGSGIGEVSGPGRGVGGLGNGGTGRGGLAIRTCRLLLLSV